jgi:bacterioferritin
VNDKLHKSGSFSLDIKSIRERARSHIEDGAVTQDYQGDRETILRLLNDSLATEIVCMLRYRRHYFMSSSLGGIVGFAVAKELLVHANEEQAHADRLAERIVQLGGEPNFDPEGLASRSHSDYVAGSDLKSMLREDLVAERIAIDIYSEIIRYVGDKDPTTRRLFEDILQQEEEHADELADFLRRVEPR